MRGLLVVALVALLAWLWSRQARATEGAAPAAGQAPAVPVGSSGQNPSLIADIQAVAQAEGVPPAVLFGIASAEQDTTNSAEWNPNAINLSDPYGGAWGLTQVLAGTAYGLGYQVPQELLNPVAALTATAKYLRKYASNVDNIAEDAQLYNAGPNATFIDTPYIDKVLAAARAWPSVQAGTLA
jgi:soluble lytic murein transglycosylase-like protein